MENNHHSSETRMHVHIHPAFKFINARMDTGTFCECTHTSDRAGWLTHLLNNALRGLLPRGKDKPYFSWYRGGLIIQSLCNHMETASHSSFIKPFIAVIAEGAPFYELLSKFCSAYVHPTSSQLQTFLKAVGRGNEWPPQDYLVYFIWRGRGRKAPVSHAVLGQT